MNLKHISAGDMTSQCMEEESSLHLAKAPITIPHSIRRIWQNLALRAEAFAKSSSSSNIGNCASSHSSSIGHSSETSRLCCSMAAHGLKF